MTHDRMHETNAAEQHDPTVYEQLLVDLREVFAFCDSLGVTRIRPGRYRQYERTLEELAASSTVAAAHDPAAADRAPLTPENIFAVCEALLLREVMALQDCDARALRTKLDLIGLGPAYPTDESPDRSGNRPRNMLFELSTAVKLKRAGLALRLGEEPDITCTFGTDEIGVACTRPFSEKSVAERIHDAARELHTHLQDYRYHSPKSRGIVAVSLSRLWNPGGKYYSYSDPAAAESQLAGDLERALRAVEFKLLKLPYMVIGVYVESIVPAIKDDNFLQLFHTGVPFITAREGTADYRLADRFFARLKDAR